MPRSELNELVGGEYWLCAGECGDWKRGMSAAHNGSGPVCGMCEEKRNSELVTSENKGPNMTALATPVAFTIQPITYEVTKAEIEREVSGAMMLRVHDFNDKAGLEQCHKTRMKLRDMRTTIERTRKKLKADALEFGRQVDSTAKELVAPIESAERHLIQEESIVQREQDRIAREAEEARQKMIRDRLQVLAAYSWTGSRVFIAEDISGLTQVEFNDLVKEQLKGFQDHSDRLAAEEAERQRIAEEQRLEAARLAVAREQLEQEQREAEHRNKMIQARMESLAQLGFSHPLPAEQLGAMTPQQWEQTHADARMEKADRDKAAAEQLARLEQQRLQQLEQQRQLDAEKQRLADEAAERAKSEAATKEQLRIDALKPDAEKLLAIADQVAAIELPPVSVSAAHAATLIESALRNCAEDIRVVANELIGGA